MGTSSLIKVVKVDKDGVKRCIVMVYGQYDGYLGGVGARLANFLRGIRLTKGLSLSAPQQPKHPQIQHVNGAEDLAALLVVQMKILSPVGGVYLMPVDTNWETETEQYTYIVQVDSTLNVTVNGRTVEQFQADCSSQPGANTLCQCWTCLRERANALAELDKSN